MGTGDTSAIVTSEGLRHDRSALAAVRALGAAGRRVVVAFSGSRSLAAASRYATATVQVPPSSDLRFGELIRRLERQHDAIAVFATSDGALRSLRPETSTLMDKVELARLATRAGFDLPPTFLFESASELNDIVADIGFPIIVKPISNVAGGATATMIPDRQRLEAASPSAGLVQPFVGGEMSATAGVVWQGRLVAILHQRYVRTFPPRAGTASFAVSVPAQPGVDARLLGLMQGIDGIFQAQFVAGMLIDLNLRPYGSMPLALKAGLNLPDIVCRLRSGEDVQPRSGAVGVRYRWIDGDIRSIVYSIGSDPSRLLHSLTAALPRRNTAHSVFSRDDLHPVAVRLGLSHGPRHR